MFERLCEWKIWMPDTQKYLWVPRKTQANNPQGEQTESTHYILTSGKTKLKEFWHLPLISNKFVSMTEVIEFYTTVLRWCCTYMRCSRTRYSGSTTFSSCPIDAVLDNRCLVQVQTINNAVWRFCVQACQLVPCGVAGGFLNKGLNGWMFLDLVICWLFGSCTWLSMKY